MSLKVHLQTGGFVCPKCGAQVSEDDTSCPNCGEKFDGVREGKRCPNCGTINDIDAVICSACGYSFGRAQEKGLRDEEFLQKLLNWSKTLAEEEEKDYQEEADQVVNVFKKITGIELDETEDDGKEIDWKKKSEKSRNFIKSFIEVLEEEKENAEKKLSNARKSSTKKILEEEIKTIEREIKGMYRIYEDIEDMRAWYEERLKKAEDEKIEKERELRKEIAKVRKESISREDEIREIIKGLNQELSELKRKLADSVSALTMLDDWIELEKRLEKELDSMKEDEKDGKIREYTYTVKEQMETLLMSVKLRVSEESELKRLLSVLDDLLEALPKKKIKQFAESEDFELYERILDRYHVGE